MRICVVGLGYIGLPTSLMLAANGGHVLAVDYNRELVDTLIAGRVTFEEKGLPELYERARVNIEFRSDYPEADVYIVAVATPYIKETHKIDPQYVCAAVRNVLDACPDGAVIVVESTVSPGTMDKFVRPVVAESGRKVRLAHAPERIIPGNMVYELIHNSRTIGADDPETGSLVRDIYATFCQGEIVLTDIRTAEMTKVVENTFRDINIAFANELLKICREDGMDVYEIIRIANKHPRVNLHQPGPGVGGHCISVDPWFLVGDYPELTQLIGTARRINDSMPEFVIERMGDIMRENGISSLERVGLYGLTYKENVDDTRESPTLQLLEALERRGQSGLVQVYDPFVARDIAPNQHHDLDSFLGAVDMVVLLVGHDEIKQNAAKLERIPVLDTRNVLDLPRRYTL